MFINFDNAPERTLPQVAEALQRLQEDPDQLALERERRYNCTPPPPYSESGETTQPPTPGPVLVDEFQERWRKWKEWNKSRPGNQFKDQAKRERDRLIYQIDMRLSGRRQTLPWDDSCDLQANSENNVRSRWVEQGIWGDEWGPAWPKNSEPSMTWVKDEGPFVGAHDPSTSKFLQGCRWGHEQGNSPSPSPEPEPPRSPISPGSLFTYQPPPPPPKPPRPLPPVGTLMPVPRPTVRDPEASRPLPQFLYQVSKERQWIEDEVIYKTPGRIVDLDNLAYDSVKEIWIKDGVWRPEWGHLPGPSWIHEHIPRDFALYSPSERRVDTGAEEFRPIATDTGHSHRGAPPALDLNDRNDNLSRPPAGAESSDVPKRTRKRGRSLLEELPAGTANINDALFEPAPRRRGRSLLEELPAGTANINDALFEPAPRSPHRDPNDHFKDNPDQPSTGAESPDVPNRTPTLSRSLLEELPAVTANTREVFEPAPRSPHRNASSKQASSQPSPGLALAGRRKATLKRGRDDEIGESDQPPKRTRRSKIGEGKTVPTSRKLRRSARIAEREKQRRIDAAAALDKAHRELRNKGGRRND